MSEDEQRREVQKALLGSTKDLVVAALESPVS
jgi:hypothetical protein